MTRINLDFSVSDAKKIAKMSAQTSENTHIHISTYTHPHTHNSTAQQHILHRAQHSIAHSTATKATAWASVTPGGHSVAVQKPNQPFEPLKQWCVDPLLTVCEAPALHGSESVCYRVTRIKQ